jgi:hypothetical protein
LRSEFNFRNGVTRGSAGGISRPSAYTSIAGSLLRCGELRVRANSSHSAAVNLPVISSARRWLQGNPLLRTLPNHDRIDASLRGIRNGICEFVARKREQAFLFRTFPIFEHATVIGFILLPGVFVSQGMELIFGYARI